MNGFEFVVKLKDLASSGVSRIAQAVGVATGKLKSMAAGIGEVDRKSKGLDGTLGKLKGTLLAAFTVGALMGFADKVGSARAEYEKFQAVMANTFQSQDVGNGAMAMLTKFAAETPYQLNELTGGFIKLVNRGINPTREEMTKMGDLASSQGKGFDQLVEAVMDAQTGEFERMKEFGIKASKSGDQVSLSFKGVTKIVKNNEQAIKDAIIQYGAMKGVAGSMEVVSKTLGGRFSNLADQWWNFLVAVGGESSGVFGYVLDALSNGIAFLTDYLPVVSRYFDIMYSYIEPVIRAFADFVAKAFDIKGSGDILDGFGKIMRGVLMVVNWFTTGLTTLINWLGPLAHWIGVITIAWGVFNALVAVTPIGWVIIGIVALITIIGMVTKYTSGWSDSWEALKTMIKMSWEQIKADFQYSADYVANRFKIIYLAGKDAAQQITGTFSKVGDAIKLALSGDFSGAFKKISEKIKTEASGEIAALQKKDAGQEKAYREGTQDRLQKFLEAKNKLGIKIDTEGISKDWDELKGQFSGKKKATADSSAYDNYIKGAGSAQAGKGSGKGSSGSKSGGGITGGGAKLTHITVNIAKMQDQIVINTINSGEGATKLRQMLEEELNRLLGSISQMQTSS
jgi:hypothetical protein